jgi:hypothetical protein
MDDPCSEPVKTSRKPKSMNSLKSLAALTIALLISATLSSAQTIIASLPYTISTAGVYVLDQSLSYSSGSGIAITVKASNVTINLNGYGITNTSDQTTTTAIGIGAYNVENLTVKNGEIFGFKYGVYLNGPTTGLSFNAGHVVQSLRLAYCTENGILLDYADNCLIQNCQASSIGRTGGGIKLNNSAIGISVTSLTGGTRIYRCQVLGATSAGISTGSVGSQGSYVEQNLATDCRIGFYLVDGREAYRDNPSFGATSEPFLGTPTDFGGNHAK